MNMELKKYLKNGYKKIFQKSSQFPPIIEIKRYMRQLRQHKQKGCFYLCHLSKNF